MVVCTLFFALRLGPLITLVGEPPICRSEVEVMRAVVRLGGDVGKRCFLIFCAACAATLSVMPSVASDTTIYTYDALGRLITTSVTGGPSSGTQTSTTFDPAGNRSSYTVSGVPGPPAFSINSVSANEGAALVFTITKTGFATGSLSVNYATSNGTASSPADYTATSGTVTFLPSETSKTIPVPTVDDALVEGNETLTMTLSGASAGATIGTATGTGTINDNDLPPPSLAVSNAAAVAEGGTLAFTVTKTGATNMSFSVNYASAGGTATSGTDFTPVSGMLTFLTGEMSKTIYVATIDDSSVEPDETVLMNLSSPTGGATITASQGSGTITNNDVANLPPVANSDSTSFICSQLKTVNVVANDTDPENNTPLSVVSVTDLSGAGYAAVSGTTSVTIGASNPGTYYFNYVVSDSLGATATGQLMATVTGKPGICQEF